jgi:hypothetical protein
MAFARGGRMIELLDNFTIRDCAYLLTGYLIGIILWAMIKMR